MKRFIIIPILVWFCVVHVMAQLNEDKRLPWDSIPPLLPPFEMKRIDTLRFNPGDTIPHPIWEKFLSKRGTTTDRTFVAPPDNMPVIVPPDHNFYMIVTKPDTAFHYYIRNGMDEKKILNSPERFSAPKRKFRQTP